MHFSSIKAISVFVVLLLIPGTIWAQSHAEHRHGDHAPAATESAAPYESLTIPDVTVLDEDGKDVRFYSELVRGKIVAINFIYLHDLHHRLSTAGSDICPTATFNQSRAGKGDSTDFDQRRSGCRYAGKVESLGR
jgi:protein SCO1